MNILAILSLALLSLTAFLIFRDAKNRGIEKKIYWVWILFLVPAFVFLRIIGIVMVAVSYFISSRYLSG